MVDYAYTTVTGKIKQLLAKIRTTGVPPKVTVVHEVRSVIPRIAHIRIHFPRLHVPGVGLHHLRRDLRRRAHPGAVVPASRRRSGPSFFRATHYLTDMTPAPTTFSELDRQGMAIEVTCQKCGHRAVVDSQSPRLRHLPIAGRRFRCTVQGCGGIGLPSIGKQRAWVRQLAEHAQSLRAPPGKIKG